MKLLVGDEKVFEELKKLGRVVFIRKSTELIAESDDLRLSAKPELFERVLECLADLGYEFAVLDAKDEIMKIEEKLGYEIPTFDRTNALNSAPELETLKTVAEKAKKNAEKCGAIGIFVGFVRKVEGDKTVERLEYEAFKELLPEKLAEVESKVKGFPGVANAKLYHKLGKLKPGEDIVYIAVVGEHRKDIWEPLMNAVELMKTELPIWKKEVYRDGERWV
ncbi:MAG: molybdopterin synthase catalytic subunit [Archaeoglobaceae archaeon]|nr:molybdopterin synthase catalytic subunit [Archaeoglobaceae archaeon]